MAKKIKLGDYNRLRIVKKVDFGLYLDGGDEGEILLPSRYVPEDAGIGDELDVFIYLDQEERLIATTETPLAKVGDFAYLEVKWVNEYGAFLGWGLMKDIFCPFREQKKRMVLGNSYIVHIHIDEESYRIVASAKIERYLNEDHPHYKHGDEVDLLIWQKTDLGFKVIIDNQYPGLLYQDQIFQYIHIVQGGHHLLCQPYILILITHLNAVLLFTNRSNICQIFCCTRTDCYFDFLLFQIKSPFLIV